MFRGAMKLFDKIPCPRLLSGLRCTVPNCLFAHDQAGQQGKRSFSSQSDNGAVKKFRPDSSGQTERNAVNMASGGLAMSDILKDLQVLQESQAQSAAGIKALEALKNLEDLASRHYKPIESSVLVDLRPNKPSGISSFAGTTTDEAYDPARNSAIVQSLEETRHKESKATFDDIPQIAEISNKFLDHTSQVAEKPNESVRAETDSTATATEDISESYKLQNDSVISSKSLPDSPKASNESEVSVSSESYNASDPPARNSKPSVSTEPEQTSKTPSQSIGPGSSSNSQSFLENLSVLKDSHTPTKSGAVKVPSSVSNTISSGAVPPKPASPNPLANLNPSGRHTTLLSPLPVAPFAPGTIPQRMTYLKAIVQALGPNPRNPNKIAMRLELKMALKSTKVTYGHNMRNLVRDIKQGNIRKYLPPKPLDSSAGQSNHEKLEALIIPVEALEQQNYICSIVTPQDPPADYLIDCARCSQKFPLESAGKPMGCTYHWARRPYDQTTQKRSETFPCCGQHDGESAGCSHSDSHVFKFSDPALMASVIPFIETPASKDSDSALFAAAIDCEMGYTTLGLELIRVTVVDWDTNKCVLDRTVYPYGQIIDLNTRFSGVSDIEQGVTMDGVHYPTLSFKEVRDSFFKFVNSSTIIVGHGLDNDLNALRIIHHRVVDTRLHYPSYMRKKSYSLKQLTFRYLGREIQTGEHDSLEDAVAAMDIIKAHFNKQKN